MSIREQEREREEGSVPVLVHVVLMDVAQVAFEIVDSQETSPTERDCVSRDRVVGK